MSQTVWVDLDATLAVYPKWEGIQKIGDPFAGAKLFMENLRAMGAHRGFKVGVFSVRTNPDMPGREELLDVGIHPDDLQSALANIIRDWLEKHGIPYDEIFSGRGKPPGLCYVDDRGVNCEPAVYGCLAYRIAESLVERMARVHLHGGKADDRSRTSVVGIPRSG